jgi:hypothetical protein
MYRTDFRFGIVCASVYLVAAIIQACHAQTRPPTSPTASAPATWAFNYPDDSRPGCLLDLRYLNEKTAGETGFVKLTPDGNGFALGNGKPVRFWSVVTDAYRLKPDEMAIHARFLAKIGVNMVRLHTQIAPPGPNGALTDVNEKEINGIWRCVAAMKKEGIYCTISPYWATAKDVSQWGIDGYTGSTDLWGLLFFNEKLQQGYKAWVKSLYTRPNPYTGIPLANDPAVAIVQVQNEDGMFFWTMQGVHPEQKAYLGKKFGAWLTTKYGSLTAAKQAWAGASNEKDDLENGVAAILDTWVLTQPQTGGMAKRTADQTQFFAVTQRKFYSDISDYYHNVLGCKQLVNASNWITADPIRLNDLERYTNSVDDVLAVNRYTGGVHIGANDGWRIDPGHHFTNNSCLLDPRSLPTNLKKVVGHPMVVTESTWVSPEGYQSEGPFLIAAYESLTGVNSLYWFAAGGTPEYETNPYFTFATVNGSHPLYKWTCSTPTLMGGFPAYALMFRRGYIKQGAPVVHEERALTDLWQRKDPILAEDKTFDPNRNTGNTGGQSNLTKGVDPLAFLVGPVEVKYGGDPSATKVIDLAPFIDDSSKIVKSETGEIVLDYGKGICTVNAPSAQGATGFLSKTGVMVLNDITITSSDAYATIACVAMDQKPLSASHKILLQIGTRARPTGWKATAADFKSDDGKQTFHGYEILSTGTMPWQINDCTATVSIKNPSLTKAIVLDTAGYPVREIALTAAAGSVMLKVPSNAMYVMLQ